MTGTFPQPIKVADITPGMDVQVTVASPTGASSTARGIVISAAADHVTFTAGRTADTTSQPSTVTYALMSAAGTPAEANSGTIVLDGSGVAWQRVGDQWSSISGDRLAWADFLTVHPTFTVLQDTPATVLPDPAPSGYPVTISPGDARLGMDVRVTVTYAAGGSRIVRGVCPWLQNNPPPTDNTPSFLCLPNIGGAELVANPDVVALMAATPSLQAQIAGRYVIAYDPLPTGVTVLVEQMQSWSAGSVWDISGIPEPPVGAIVRSRDGTAWQRTGNATTDGPVIDDGGPWVFAGQGMWSSVAGDYPRSFLWLWGVAAPFIVQEEA